MPLRTVTLDQLTIDDEASVACVAVYGRLKQALRRSGHRFLLPATEATVGWDRALFLNLTYWSGPSDARGPQDGAKDAVAGGGADVLCNDHVAADEILHMAWHHVVGRQLASQAVDATAPPSGEALFFSESIASAFDLYLVGRLLHDAPDSDFIASQVPLIAERAEDAGLSKAAFGRLLEEVCRDPERAFEDLRALLFDVATALLACTSAIAAQQALEGFVGHRFEPLLHHFEISNWILYARAYGARAAGTDAVVRRLDGLLRLAPHPLRWIEEWIDDDDDDDDRVVVGS